MSTLLERAPVDIEPAARIEPAAEGSYVSRTTRRHSRGSYTGATVPVGSVAGRYVSGRSGMPVRGRYTDAER